MTTVSDQPDLAEVLRIVLRYRLSRVWTALPGVVESYDATSQRASVKPGVVSWMPLADGEELEELPVVPNVPVVHPSGGGFFCAFPLQRGDPVLLVFCARDVAAWKAGDGSVARAADNRMHDLTDAFAIPGGRPRRAALQDASAEDLVLGRDGGALVRVTPQGDVSVDPADGTVHLGAVAGDEPVALADKTDSRISALESAHNDLVQAFNTFLQLYNTHTQTSTATFQPLDVNSGGQAVTVGPPTPPGVVASLMQPGTSVAARKVKAT